jgi:hypothetical protein
MKITRAYAVMIGLAAIAKGGVVKDRWRMCEIMVVGRWLRHADARLQAIILIDRSTERTEPRSTRTPCALQTTAHTRRDWCRPRLM